MKKINEDKIYGQVNTPTWIVNQILNMVEYSGTSIINKYIMEPSCGDGAFMVEIIKRYISECLLSNIPDHIIIENLGKYIYGIELDEVEYNKCITNLNSIVHSVLGDYDVDWKIYNQDTLQVFPDFDGKFDYVVGNPPYVRIHHINKELRTYLKNSFFFTKGTIDMYLCFFEIAITMCNDDGVIGYITPNSYFRNTSYKGFRNYLKNREFIKTIVNFKSSKVFENHSTYTAITILNKKNNEEFDYYELKDEFIKKVNTISNKSLSDDYWNFGTIEDLSSVENYTLKSGQLVKDLFNVQYGIATLRDKIFIGNATNCDDENLMLFNGYEIEKPMLREIVKGSKFKREFVLFPYQFVDGKYVPISEEKLICEYPKCYLYLQENKNELLNRDIDKGSPWYAYGRSQGIQTTNLDKIMLGSFVGDKIKYAKIDGGTLVTSGIIITKKNEDVDWQLIENLLSSNDLFKYIKLTGKYFSGEYNSVTPKQIKECVL